MELSSSNIKKFSQRKTFLIFQEMELSYISGNENPERKILIFQETELFYISGNRNPKKLLIFQETETLKRLIFQEITFRVKKLKRFLYFGKRNFIDTSLKNLYFRRELAKPENQKFHIFCLSRENFSNKSAKRKKFLILSLTKEPNFLN